MINSGPLRCKALARTRSSRRRSIQAAKFSCAKWLSCKLRKYALLADHCVKSAKEMDGATICVAPGTSTELAIADYFRVNKLKFTPILIQDASEITAAYESGRCDAYSTDASALAAYRATQGPKAPDHVLRRPTTLEGNR